MSSLFSVTILDRIIASVALPANGEGALWYLDDQSFRHFAFRRRDHKRLGELLSDAGSPVCPVPDHLATEDPRPARPTEEDRMTYTVLCGDARDRLAELEAAFAF